MHAFFSWMYVIYFFASSAVLVCVSGLICLLTAPFDKNRRLVHLFSCAWGHSYIALNPFWKCSIEGRVHIQPKQTYVLISNHQSLMDIIVLYGLFRHYKWVSKEDIFKVPFIGWNMYLNQYVSLRRGNMKSIKVMLKTCRDWMEKGS